MTPSCTKIYQTLRLAGYGERITAMMTAPMMKGVVDGWSTWFEKGGEH